MTIMADETGTLSTISSGCHLRGSTCSIEPQQLCFTMDDDVTGRLSPRPMPSFVPMFQALPNAAGPGIQSPPSSSSVSPASVAFQSIA